LECKVMDLVQMYEIARLMYEIKKMKHFPFFATYG
jgi:hypothetical protein